jgi:putative ABC transport system substrate-binding protein
MRRREFIGLIAATAWPLVAMAQTAKGYRVGTLTPGPPVSATADGAALFDGLAKRAMCLDKT